MPGEFELGSSGGAVQVKLQAHRATQLLLSEILTARSTINQLYQIESSGGIKISHHSKVTENRAHNFVNWDSCLDCFTESEQVGDHAGGGEGVSVSCKIRVVPNWHLNNSRERERERESTLKSCSLRMIGSKRVW